MEILHRFENIEDGFEVHVINNINGYAVTIYNTDSGDYFPSVQVFPSELWAVGIAKSIVNGYEYNHAKEV